MKALIVYDSVYGNTEKIARAIAGALTPSGEVKVLRAGELNPSEFESVDLLVVGSPTQGGRPTPAIKEFLSKIPANALKNVSVTSFDTRFSTRLVRPFGYAAGRIADILKDKGGHLAAPPEGFIVKGKEGSLKEGELERAAGWAKGILESKK
jgi:flavodoxin I